MKTLRNIFFRSRLYFILFGIVLLFIASYIVPFLFIISKIALLIFAAFLATDLFFLCVGSKRIDCERFLPNRLSMGDENVVTINVKNFYPFPVKAEIIDELPVQFQKRDFTIIYDIKKLENISLQYKLIPKERGEFEFGNIHVYVSTKIGLILYRHTFNLKSTLPVYPSFIQMRKYELLAMTNRMDDSGVKKVRKAGKHTEFDQVREYVTGDDYRLMNWKATAKHARLMVNQYQEERSKDVYCIIDMGRVMKMPFEGMTLLDYAINSSLAISNISVLKHDKAGLITFNNKIDTFVQADRKNKQMMILLEALYKQKTVFLESNLEILYLTIKKNIHQRSLLILFTNFESLSALHRQISALQNLAVNHLVLAVVFENTEVSEMINPKVESLEDIYISVIAEKFLYDKKIIVKELNKYGIKTIFTTPENLTINLINKYLEFKAAEMI
jgi:uncharacterized protein (DUF58 family)